MSAPAYDRLRMIESAKRPIAGCLACLTCLIILVALAYRVTPFERLDIRVLSEFRAPQGSCINRVAFRAERLVSPLAQVVAVVLACLIALCQARPRHAFVAIAIVAGTALIVQALKIALAHPRYQPILGQHQIESTSFPSGNSAGALSIALAFLYVAPRSWRHIIAAIGIVLTLAVSVGLLVLTYHYPSDVVGGWLVAAGWWLASLAALRMTGAPHSERQEQPRDTA
jgi:membrane-associated phospholipid phosphatase